MRLKPFIASTIAVIVLTVSAIQFMEQPAPKPENKPFNPSAIIPIAELVGSPLDQHTCDIVMSYEPFRMTYEQCFGRTKNVNMLCELLASEHLPSPATSEEDAKHRNILMVCPIAMLLNYPMTISDGVIEVDVPNHRK